MNDSLSIDQEYEVKDNYILKINDEQQVKFLISQEECQIYEFNKENNEFETNNLIDTDNLNFSRKFILNLLGLTLPITISLKKINDRFFFTILSLEINLYLKTQEEIKNKINSTPLILEKFSLFRIDDKRMMYQQAEEVKSEIE